MSARPFARLLLVAIFTGLSPSAPASVNAGVLQPSPGHAADLKAAGLSHVVLSVSWDRFQPAPDRTDPAYLHRLRADISAYRHAGLGVILDTGIQYPPAWLLRLPGARYVNQHGAAFIDPAPGKNVANFVFNSLLRERQLDYLAALFKQLGTDWTAVRLGGGWYGELRVCLGKKSGQREGERVLGQGDRGGGDPAGRAAEGNAGPVPFLPSLAERQQWPEFFPRHTLTTRPPPSPKNQLLLGLRPHRPRPKSRPPRRTPPLPRPRLETGENVPRPRLRPPLRRLVSRKPAPLPRLADRHRPPPLHRPAPDALSLLGPPPRPARRCHRHRSLRHHPARKKRRTPTRL